MLPAGDAPLYTSEHPVPHEPDARWLARRARNVARRPLALALFAGIGFLLALLTVVAAPLGVQQVRRVRAVPVPERVDTMPLARAASRASARVEGAQLALAEARDAALAPPPVPVVVDTFPPALRARRDSLAVELRELTELVRRASEAPLAASFRALGDAPRMRGDPAVRILIDSLAAVERARGEFEAIGLVDPVFIALTQRANALGAELVAIGERKRDALRRETQALAPPPPAVPEPTPATDTMPFRIALDSVRGSLAEATAALTAARQHNDSVTVLERRARRSTTRSASPPVMIAAAGALGVAIGFLLALAGEMRRPAVADPREAEVAAGAPVVAVLRDEPPGRTRRRADRDVPPLIELTTDTYDRLYHRLADVVARLPRIAVLGDDAAVVATVSANLAAAAARTARATLLLDTDLDQRSVSSVMRVRATPGVADVLAHRVHWSSALIPVVVGRDRSVDVLPAGSVKGGASLGSAAASFRDEVEHFARRYDSIIVSAPTSRRGAVTAVAAAVGQAIICVRRSHTGVRSLQRILEEARQSGATLRGVVLWDRDSPVLLAPEDVRPTSVAASGAGMTAGV